MHAARPTGFVIFKLSVDCMVANFTFDGRLRKIDL